jgi:CheY-like chemotaxis protein
MMTYHPHNPMAELTPRDDNRKRVSEILKRVDELIRSKDYEQAKRETDRAREIDPRNVYIGAYEERLAALIEQATKERVAEEERRKLEKERRKREEQARVERLERQLREEAERKKELEEKKNREQAEEAHKRDEAGVVRKQPEQRAAPPRSAQEALVRGPASVFVIDDDEKLLYFVKEIIEDAGYRVRAFTSSDDAFTVLKTEAPDIILSDINLETSTMGGFSFYERIRELDHLQEVPFVFLSGLSDDVLIRTGKELGIDDYLTKPFSEQHLLSVIKGKIKRFRQLKKRRK